MKRTSKESATDKEYKLDVVKCAITALATLPSGENIINDPNIVHGFGKFLYRQNDSMTIYSTSTILCLAGMGLEWGVFSPIIMGTRATKMTIEVDDTQAKLRMDNKTQAKLSFVKTAAEEPTIPTTWKPFPKGLLDGLQFCAKTASDDYSKYTLTHILVAGKECLSSDSFRVSSFLLGDEIGKDLLVPKKAVPCLVKMYAAKYARTKTSLWFSNESETVMLECVMQGDIHLPNLSELFPQDFDIIASLDKDAIEELALSGLVSAKEDLQKRLVKVTTDSSKETITIVGTGAGGEIEVVVDAKVMSDEDFHINPEWFVEALCVSGNFGFANKGTLLFMKDNEPSAVLVCLGE